MEEEKEDKEKEEVAMEGESTEAPGGEREEVDMEGGREVEQDDDFDNRDIEIAEINKAFQADNDSDSDYYSDYQDEENKKLLTFSDDSYW